MLVALNSSPQRGASLAPLEAAEPEKSLHSEASCGGPPSAKRAEHSKSNSRACACTDMLPMISDASAPRNAPVCPQSVSDTTFYTVYRLPGRYMYVNPTDSPDVSEHAELRRRCRQSRVACRRPHAANSYLRLYFTLFADEPVRFALCML